MGDEIRGFEVYWNLLVTALGELSTGPLDDQRVDEALAMTFTAFRDGSETPESVSDEEFTALAVEHYNDLLGVVPDVESYQPPPAASLPSPDELTFYTHTELVVRLQGAEIIRENTYQCLREMGKTITLINQQQVYVHPDTAAAVIEHMRRAAREIDAANLIIERIGREWQGRDEESGQP